MGKLLKLASLAMFMITNFFVSSCNQQLPDTLSYRCDLSGSSVDVDRNFGAQFAKELSVAANLRVISDTPVTGVLSADSTYIIELESNEASHLGVTIICERKSKTFILMIEGGIQNPEAKRIGEKAGSIFIAKLPGRGLMPFTAERGFLGP